MKKILDSKFLFIIALSLIVLIILGFGAFYLFDDSDDTFVKSGYVINPLSPKVERYFFDEDVSYKENLSSMVVFKDVDNNDASILKDSFLHYNDGSLSFLKNGAILDLNSIRGTEAVNFYNITSKSIIEKDGNNYTIKTNGEDIKLRNFIGRINDNKYIVVGSLEAKIPGNETNIAGDYFEIVYTEEGVVNVENKDVKYQVTAEGTLIYAGDIVIDLGNKKITKSGEDVMSITAITINGDENIEIIPVTPEEKEENENGNNGAGEGTGEIGTGEEGEGGTGEENIQVEKEESIIVSLKDASIGSTNVDVTFDIYNQKEDDIFSLKVTNLDSGRTVDMYEAIMPDEEFRVDLLSPNTKYLFTVTNEKDGNKYFQKIFETTDFGIKLEKSYATDSEIGYKITVADDTDITNAKLSLYKYNEETKKNEIVTTSYKNNDGEVETIQKVTTLSSLKGNIEGVHEIIFDGLDSDTIYTAVLDEFSVVSSNFKDIYNITLTSMTLKKTPIFNNMIANKNVGAGSFKLSLDNIEDPDNAILNYTYMIYQNDNPDRTVIDPITKTNASPIEVKIGDKPNQLKNDTNYFYKAIIEYYDNEKYIEYIMDDTINFVMGSDPYVTVVPNDKLISYDRIAATIYLTDNSCLISMPGREKCNDVSNLVVDVSKINSITGEKTSVFAKNVDFQINDEEIKYELDIDKLQAGTTYNIEVRAIRNDKPDDGRVEILHTDESRRNITTKSLSSFITDWQDKKSGPNNVVNLETQFVAEEGSGTLSPEDTANSIQKVVVRLYEGDNVENLQSQQPIGEKEIFSDEEGTLKEKFYDKAYPITTEDTFGMDLDYLTEKYGLSEYYTIAIYAYYDVNGTNEVRLDNNVIKYQINPALLMVNLDEPTLTIKEKANKGSKLDNNLNNDSTVVGYEYLASFNRNQLLEYGMEPKQVNLYVYNTEGNKIPFYIKDENGKLLPDPVSQITDELGENGFSEGEIYLGDGTEYGVADTVMRRGNVYYIGYEIVVLKDGDELTYTGRKIREFNYGIYEEVKPEKETPTVKMYIAKSTSDTITYRYDIKDPDNAMYRESNTDDYGLYYIVNDSVENKFVLNKVNGEYNMFSGDMTIPNLSNGDTYSIYYKKNSLKTGVFEQDVANYFDGKDEGKRIFDGYYDAKNGEYNFQYEVINNGNNKVGIKILASDLILDRILSYRVKFSDSKGNVLPLELWKLNTCEGEDEENKPRCLYVDYIDLKDAGMKSENNEENIITVTVDALYDNGLTGYDYTVGEGKDYQYMIMQSNIIPDETPKYIVYSNKTTSEGILMGVGELTTWSESIEAPKAYYTYLMMSNQLNYRSELTGKSDNIKFNLSSSGYSSKHGIMNPKMVSIDSMSSDKKTFSFNSITPRISINKTTSIINGAVVNLSLFGGADINDFCEDGNGDRCINKDDSEFYLYIETWNSPERAGDLSQTVRPPLKVKINNKNTSEELKAVIDKLNHASNYYYNVYAYLNTNNKKVYTQLFDASYTAEYKVKTYDFSSLTSDDIYHNYEINYKYNPEGNYNDKLMNAKFNLIAYQNNLDFNFDFAYAFCDINDSSCGVRETDTNIFKREMAQKDISTNFTDTFDITQYDLEYNKNYYIRVFAIYDYYDYTSKRYTKNYLQVNRRDVVVNLRKLTMPEFVISREADYIDNDYVINFGINVNDPDRVLLDGKYYVKLLDNDGNIVGDLQEKDGDTYVTRATNGEYEDYTFDALVANKNIRIKGLDPDTKYTIFVYNDAYINNYDENTTKEERTVEVINHHTVYSVSNLGVAFGKEIKYSATEKSIIVTFLGGSKFDNVKSIDYTIGLWDNTQSTSTHAGSYVIGEDDKKFEMFKDTGDWRFVIDPDGMSNVLGQFYTVTLDFSVEDSKTGNIGHFYSSGTAQYVKDNNINN